MPNPPTNIVDLRVLLQHNLNFKGWNFQAHRDFLGIFPESLTRAMLVGTMLVGRLGVGGACSTGIPGITSCRRRENMVGANMVLA